MFGEQFSGSDGDSSVGGLAIIVLFIVVGILIKYPFIYEYIISNKLNSFTIFLSILSIILGIKNYFFPPKIIGHSNGMYVDCKTGKSTSTKRAVYDRGYGFEIFILFMIFISLISIGIRWVSMG